MNEYSAKNKAKKYTKDEIFANTQKTGSNAFFKEFEKLIRDTQNCKGKRHIIFIDKNHPPSAFPRTTEAIR